MSLIDFVTGMKFNPIAYQPNSIDVQQLGKSYESLRQMHDEAMANKTKLESAIANTPLDESEEPYRKMILDTIENSSNEVTDEFGLAGAAEKINSLVANITNSKVFREKVDANLKHKKFLEELHKLNLPVHVEKYYKEKNPYEVKHDLVDSNGREVMYEWEPKVPIVPLPDTNKIIETALKQLSPNKSGGYVNSYLYDALGNKLDDWRQGGFQLDSTGNKVWLPPEKISSAIKEIIKRDKGVEEAFRKQFEIGKWYDDKNKDTDDPTYARQIPFAEDGFTTMDFNQWLDYLFTPAAENISYYEGYPPTAAMRNKEAGITPTRRTGGSNSSKRAETEEKKEVRGNLISSGLSSTAATRVYNQAKSSSKKSQGQSSTKVNKTPNKSISKVKVYQPK